MSTLREAAQQALEALENSSPDNARPECVFLDKHQEAIAALRAALAQEEPVASQNTQEKCRIETVPAKGGLLSIHPPRRETEQEPVAWGLFAETDGEWQLQYPVFVGGEFGKRNAEAEAAACNSLYPIDVRPLYTYPPRRETEQQEQEPVTDLRCAFWLDPECADAGACQSLKFKANPPRREWQSLTEEEIGDVFQAARNAKLGAANDNSRHRLSVVEIARAVEQALKERNT
jgi:hypothetical protein